MYFSFSSVNIHSTSCKYTVESTDLETASTFLSIITVQFNTLPMPEAEFKCCCFEAQLSKWNTLSCTEFLLNPCGRVELSCITRTEV